MSFYEKNLLLIQKTDGELYDAVKGRESEIGDAQFLVEKARNGMPVICCTQNGKKIYMNSRYDPVKEAEVFASQYADVRDYAYMIFLGLGNGLAAETLVNTRGEHVSYFFYEPSEELFLLVMRNYDLSGLLENKRVKIVVKNLNDMKLDKILSDGITYENYKLCIFDCLPTYKQLFSEETGWLEEKYRYYVMSVRTDLATGGMFANAFLENNIYNLRMLFSCNSLEQFKDVFPLDRPAIVVGAGPSLEKNIEYLKRAKGKFFIIAVDTVLRYLVSEEIYPDLAVMVDPEKPLELFEDERIRGISLAVGTDSNYRIVERMTGKLIVIFSRSEYYKSLFKMVEQEIGVLSNGGSVATVAFVLAYYWGYRKIVLVGQDLAFQPDKVHAGKDDIDTYKLDEEKIEVEGYYGDRVYTSEDYDYYRKWYELKIQQEPEMEVINATEGGARIAGATQMALKEVLEAYDVDSFDFENTIREMQPVFPPERRESIVGKWNESIAHLAQLKQILYDGIRQTRNGIKLIQGKRYKHSEIARLQKRIARLVADCEGMEEMFFLEEKISPEEGDILGDIYFGEEDNDEEACRVFEKLNRYMQAMYDAVDEVRGLFENIILEEQKVTGDGA